MFAFTLRRINDQILGFCFPIWQLDLSRLCQHVDVGFQSPTTSGTLDHLVAANMKLATQEASRCVGVKRSSRLEFTVTRHSDHLERL